MKTFFTLLSSLFLSVALFAAAPSSRLTIKSDSRSDIRVIIDGKNFEPNQSSMMVMNVDAGMHDIKVYREKRNGFSNMFGKRYEIVYNSSLMVKPRTHLLINVDQFGRTTIDEQKIKRQDRDRRDDDYGYGQGQWGQNEGWYDGNGSNYSKAITSRDFNQVVTAIQKEWFEGNKLKSAQHIISMNYFTSDQVSQLISLFTFENNKLDLAKMAYAKTVDQRNFYLQVSDELSFSSSKDELARFIRNFR